MEMDAYVRAGRGTSGPRGDGVVMISVRSRTRLGCAGACPCSRSARRGSALVTLLNLGDNFCESRLFGPHKTASARAEVYPQACYESGPGWDCRLAEVTKEHFLVLAVGWALVLAPESRCSAASRSTRPRPGSRRS